MTQLNLFGYPRSPGFKEVGTSRDAARAVEPDAAVLREKAYSALARAGERGWTADEVAALLHRNILSVRPRISELAKANRIVRTGERRKNESGLRAAVWKVP